MTDFRRKHLGEYVSQVESQKFRIKPPPPPKKNNNKGVPLLSTKKHEFRADKVL